MNYYFITGTSKGLGKALTELVLEDASNYVYGISRTNNISHKNFTFIALDLSNLSEVKNFKFPTISDATKIVLINNAGIVGDIKHIGNLDNEKIISTYSINLISPTILTNLFISSFSSTIKKQIINISSGAGHSPIDGWSVYCATKAGLDMFSLVLQEEINANKLNIKTINLAPGIIDTNMQDEIRRADEANFTNIKHFVEYKNNGDLAHPTTTAKQVMIFLLDEKLMENTLCSVKDLT